jgi:hypothetical protein
MSLKLNPSSASSAILVITSKLIRQTTSLAGSGLNIRLQNDSPCWAWSAWPVGSKGMTATTR